MDKFVIITKPSLNRVLDAGSSKPKPYQTHLERAPCQQRVGQIDKDPPQKLSSAALTKHLLSTLQDESNPITHSDIGLRTEHITSMFSGHQRSEGPRWREKEYLQNRNRKLNDQQLQNARRFVETEGAVERPGSKVLDRVRIYIDGYLDNMTDIEMKRIVTQAGGRIMNTAAGATHILTSQQLSASKTHKILTTKSRHKVHVVKPEWVVDSISAGKRRLEREYSVIKVASNRSLVDMLQR